MEIFLHTFIRLKDPVRTEEVLHTCLERGLHVKSVYLNSLGNSMNLPDTLYALLHKFDRKFGVIASRRFQVQTELKKSSISDSITEKLDARSKQNPKFKEFLEKSMSDKEIFSKKGDRKLQRSKSGRLHLAGGDDGEVDKFIGDISVGSRKEK